MIQPKRKSEKSALFGGLILTALIHGAILVPTMLGQSGHSTFIKPPTFVQASLIQMGKPEATDESPVEKITKEPPPKPVAQPKPETPPPAPKPELAPSLTAKKDDKPIKKKKKKKKRTMSDQARMDEALRKAALFSKANEEIASETKKGVSYGAAQGKARGDAKAKYMTRIADIWNRNWSLPAIIDPVESKKLYTLVILKINKNGKIRRVIFTRKSGNSHFDSSVERAWLTIGTIPVPPPIMGDSILKKGLKLKITWKGLR